MSTITNHYNVAIQSRFYAFLQEDIESAEPQVLIATAEKKREILKENKSKAKKEKRAKQIADAKKEIISEEVHKIEDTVVDVTHSEEEKVIEVTENFHEVKTIAPRGERRFDRGQRARGINKRGGRDDSFRNDENHQVDDMGNRTQNENHQRPFVNNRGRPYRRDRTDDREDSFNKVGYFEEQSQSGYRGGADRRRPYSRGARSSRGNDRTFGEDCHTRVDTADNVDTFEDGGERPPTRGGRGRYPRSSRGSFNRFPRPNAEESNELEHNKNVNFDENVDNNEHLGNGRSRGGRGGRRGGRDEYRRPREPEPEANNKEDNCSKIEEQSEEPVDNWGSVKDEINLDKLTQNDPVVTTTDHSNGFEVNEDKKPGDWNEIEDDPREVKVDQKVTMTLDEWKALKERTLRETMDNKEDIRKANDGRDVFSGMAEYRKGKGSGVGSGGGGSGGSGGVDDPVDEVVHETPVHDLGHSRLKQTIPVSVRFSRSTGNCDDVSVSHNYEPSGGDRSFVPRGRDTDTGGVGVGGGGGGGRGRGRSRTGQDYRGGRDYGRGRGRATRGQQYNQGPSTMTSGGGGGGGGGGGRRRDLEQGDAVAADVNINLGNEEEFPQLR